MIHTDIGSTNYSNENWNLMSCNKWIGSMSRKGNCLNSDAAVSFFSTFCKEIKGGEEFDSNKKAWEKTSLFIGGC